MSTLSPESGITRFLRYATLERGLSDNTVDAYRRDLDAYAGWLAEQGIDDLAQVNPETLSAYVAELAGAPVGESAAERSQTAGDEPRDTGSDHVEADPTEAAGRGLQGTGEEVKRYSPGTIKRRLSTVRSLHRFLFEEGLIEQFAGSGVRTPKLGQRLPKALTIEEVEAMLGATGGETSVGLRDRALLELLYASGARVSEITALDVDDLISESTPGDVWTDPEHALTDGGLIRVTGKGSKQRLIPYGSYAGAALAAYLVRARPKMVAAGRGTPALFIGPRGARMSRQSVWLVIRAAAERAEITSEVSPHTMRHSFATHLLAGGADVRTVQELLGHSSVTTTQIYTQVTADTLREHYLTAHPRARG